MLFNSIQFAIFLPIVFVLYWLFPKKYRWIVLLISSYVFYMSWNPGYIILIVSQSVISFLAALWINKESDKKRKKTILTVSIVLELSALVAFKYLNFLLLNVNGILKLIRISGGFSVINIILPVGISFYTFQTISYIYDVYVDKLDPEKNIGLYCTYVAYFPQLVAGPIERSTRLLPQIREEHEFSYEKAVYGMKLLTWGFFKKLAIADVLGMYVDRVYADVHSYTGSACLIAIIFFSFQIYCDFSGYSDIAIGVSKLFDIDLMINFKSPYISLSVKEFWGRWHISLSSWFRDYVYIPLGGNRCSNIRNAYNLMITFLLSGLWHGASWTYVLWGGMHGAMQLIERTLWDKLNCIRKNTLFRVLLWCIVFIFCNIAWVFFRAKNLSDAIYVITHVFDGMSNLNVYMHHGLAGLTAHMPGIAFCIILLAVFDVFSEKVDVFDWIKSRSFFIRHGIYIAMLMIIILFRAQRESVFVYFQF